MPVSLQILPEHYLVCIRYDGLMRVAENAQVLADIVGHPAFRKGMRGLVDLTGLTDWERDFPAIMRLHAAEAEVHDNPYRPTLLVCIAPDDHSRRIAQIINRTWDSSGRKVTVTVETAPEAFAVLGIDAPSVAALLQST